MRRTVYDVLHMRRCCHCYGKLDGRYAIDIVQNGSIAAHRDAIVCFRFAAARLRSMRFGGRRAARRRRKRSRVF